MRFERELKMRRNMLRVVADRHATRCRWVWRCAPVFAQATPTPTLNSGDTAWMIVASMLVLMMTIPGVALVLRRHGACEESAVGDDAMPCDHRAGHRVVDGLRLLAGFQHGGYAQRCVTNWHSIIGGFESLSCWRTHAGIALPDGAGKRVRDVPAHLRDHHAGTDHRRVRRTHEVQRDAVVQRACGLRSSTCRWRTWFGAARVRCWAIWACSISRAARWCISMRALPVWLPALVLGKRRGYPHTHMPPHNLGYTVIGASLLWLGWFGFNAGSAVAANGSAGMAMLVTQIATAAAAIGWVAVEWMVHKRASVLGIASGAVAGLVAITPAAGTAGPGGALILGFIAGAVCFFTATQAEAQARLRRHAGCVRCARHRRHHRRPAHRHLRCAEARWLRHGDVAVGAIVDPGQRRGLHHRLERRA
jgi:Amt family ammonium transporter